MTELEKVITVTDDERTAFAKSDAMFHMGITPYYASLMDPEDPNDPIRLQSVPKLGELVFSAGRPRGPAGRGASRTCRSRASPTAIRIASSSTPPTTARCTAGTVPASARWPTRPAPRPSPSRSEGGLKYIEEHTEIRDVVISGGDPLSLSDERLDYILGRLRAIPHVEIFRLGTRNLVTLPQRVTDDFVKMLRKHHPVYVNTHYNHPKECTAEAFEACRRLADAGCVIGNQMVLLKGINDDPKIVKELNHKLLMMRVRPYYIYQCDLSQGISHFRTPIETGIKIIEALRGHTSGLAVPHFVVDAPNGGGKIPLMPEYVLKHEGKKWTLRNYEGKQFVYEEP